MRPLLQRATPVHQVAGMIGKSGFTLFPKLQTRKGVADMVKLESKTPTDSV